jgi:3-phenylpropionate/trans-cinnamate dioxygenase ferredoxin reductase subunit
LRLDTCGYRTAQHRLKAVSREVHFVSAQHVVVVGASLAGLRTVQGLRQRGSEARITLIGAESGLPYNRPPLSKEILTGKAEPESVRLISPEDFAALDVEYRDATTATGLDLASKVLTLHTGESLSYGILVIATGSAPRRIPSLPDLGGVHVLRTLEDALALKRDLDAATSIAVIGGGFIGAEVASSARSLGKDAAIIDVLPVLMQRGLGEVLAERMTQLHRDAGIALHLGVGVDGLVGTQRVEGVRLADGTVVPADVVVVGIGTAPNTQWLEDSGLQIADGVVCDEYLRAAPDVFAVGDVARWAHPAFEHTIRAEHWTAAVEHADVVAATILGTPTVMQTVPYVWSDQLGIKLQIAGHITPEDEIEFVLDEDGKWLALTGSGGVQHGIAAVKAPGPFIKQKMKLAAGAPWPPVGE